MEKLANLDLRLLQLFLQIHRHRNLSRAAEQLRLTQPAVSLALGRLRRHFGDPLFVRVGATMEPTPVADGLQPLAAGSVALLEAVLAFQPSFDPLRDERVFRIGMTDVGQIVVLPGLLDTLARVAPRVQVAISPISPDTADQLERGVLDVALGFLPDWGGRFMQQALFAETFSCLVRRGHPRIGDTLSKRQYQDELHVVVDSEGTGHYVVERQLARKGLARRSGLQIPNFIGLAPVIGSTDFVATLPTRAARILAEQAPLRVLPLPVDVPAYRVRQQWHERMHRDPGHRWMREVLKALIAPGS